MVILFAEMRGFTGMSDMLDPQVVLERVGEFVSFMSKAVVEHEGAVVNILSDTVMATFTGQDDAQHAVEAAQEIQTGFTGAALRGRRRRIRERTPDARTALRVRRLCEHRAPPAAPRKVRRVRALGDADGPRRRDGCHDRRRGTPAAGNPAPRSDQAVPRAARFAAGLHPRVEPLSARTPGSLPPPAASRRRAQR